MIDPPTSAFPEALAALNRLFACSLFDAKQNSSHAAKLTVGRAKNPTQKIEAVEQHFQGFVGRCVSAIREWWPKYIEMAQAYPMAVGEDALRWTEKRVWERLEGGCGAKGPSSFDIPQLPPERISDTVVRWFVGACEVGRIDIRSLQRPWTWRAPRWLARDQAEQNELMRGRSHQLALRFHGVIEEEKLRSKLALAIKNLVSPVTWTRRETDGGFWLLARS